MELLYRQQAEKVSDEPWTMADLALLDEAQAAMREAPRTYGHIVVDEAQDLSKMQLRAIRRRSKNGSMTVVGDIAQSTGPYSRDSWDDIAFILGDGTPAHMPSQIAELEHGYRVPKQVFDVALPILQSAAPSVTPPRILRDVDYAPRFAGVPTGELAEEVARTVFTHSGRGRFVGVVAPLQLWPGLREAFQADDLQWSESTEGELSTAINLVTPEDAKGLEFDAVIVVDPAIILEMPHGERMLYIALTRTTTHLDVIYPLGSLPPILGGDEEQSPDTPDDESEQCVVSPDASLTSQDPDAGTDISEPAEQDESVVPDPDPVPPAGTTAGGGTDDMALAKNEMGSLDGMQQAMAVHWAKFFSTQLSENVPAKLIPAVLEELARMKLDDDA
jgi:hypothetical protein